MKALHAQAGAKVVRSFSHPLGLQVLRVPNGESVRTFVAKYQKSGFVEYAEPDYRLRLTTTTPNDPKYLDGLLWGLVNIGQNGGTPDADIDAPEAWDTLHSASNVIVAVLDTGVRYSHEDLTNNIWVNCANSPCFHVGNEQNQDRYLRNITVMTTALNVPPLTTGTR